MKLRVIVHNARRTIPMSSEERIEVDYTIMFTSGWNIRCRSTFIEPPKHLKSTLLLEEYIHDKIIEEFKKYL